MTHAFFKALLFLGSGSVIHAMANDQDMRRMGGMKLYMPVTFVTMVIGALAIAGIPPLSGFFSKDEILFRTFLYSPVLWLVAVVTAGMTAFYMFRLISMTFFGPYRGPAWEHPAEGAGHGTSDQGHGDDAHGAWHGPHESPRVITWPLMVLASGAMVAGFVGVPAALFGSNWIEHFLEPSFTSPLAAAGEGAAPHMSQGGELGLMLSVSSWPSSGSGWPTTSMSDARTCPRAWQHAGAGPHRILTNKYYVDELYDATAVRGTMSSARGLWAFDGAVVDGAVNGTGWLTPCVSLGLSSD